MQNKNDPSVGERIREGRAKSGLSQLELAEKVNVSQPTYIAVGAGQTETRLGTDRGIRGGPGWDHKGGGIV